MVYGPLSLLSSPRGPMNHDPHLQQAHSLGDGGVSLETHSFTVSPLRGIVLQNSVEEKLGSTANIRATVL